MSQVNRTKAPGRLYLVCGKMASGKSTLAAQLAQDHQCVLLAEDDLLANLYPDQVRDVQSYVRYTNCIKAALVSHLKALLDHGVSLVLDFPANTAVQRRWLFELVDKNSKLAELHYLEVSDSVCKERLIQRARKHPERAATDTVEMFDAITKHFEPPTQAEGIPINSTR